LISVKRVDIDPFHYAEGRNKLAVVHALEDGNKFALISNNGLGCHGHGVGNDIGFVVERVEDPAASVEGLFVCTKDELSAKLVVVGNNVLISGCESPVKNGLVNFCALEAGLIELGEAGI